MQHTLSLALILLSFSALGEENHQFLHNANPSSALFQCEQNTIGQTACQAGHRCKCTYNAFGNAMLGLPPGYRWDCGLEQGTCTIDIPATTSGNYGNPPLPTVPTPQMVLPSRAR